ncbi:hypothetical protein ABXT63_00785 [Candidatus Pelagibacter sp. Uisw_092]|uniref:hypothetical protein n=1 Tax=Candidatus Pelagibacter sp. Uisw_092 TaxID=3230979 RepID=UPI0039ED8752
MNNFSFQEYKKIIKHYQKFLTPILFSQIKKNSNNFFTIRHDVEFSVDRAFQLAEIEKKDLNVRSSFFFN